MLMNLYGINSLLAAIHIDISHGSDWKPLLLLLMTNTVVSLLLYGHLFKGLLLRGISINSREREKFHNTRRRISRIQSRYVGNSSRLAGAKSMRRAEPLENKNKYDDYRGTPGNVERPEVKGEVKSDSRLNIKKEQVPTNPPVVENGPENKTNAGNDKIKKENDMLTQKIKEQKKILRKKIETARRNAYVTRKPEEIEKTEKIIKDILNKYELTEESLNDDA
jgi:hypothetical protein